MKIFPKNIILNSSRLILKFSNLYCGISLYCSKYVSHDFELKGGSIPFISSHSVIESPESVNRVKPPIIIIKYTIIMKSLTNKKIIYLFFSRLNTYFILYIY